MRKIGMSDVVIIKHYNGDGDLLLHKEVRNGEETVFFKKEEY